MSNIISGDIDNIHCQIVGVGLVKNCRFPQTISEQNPPLYPFSVKLRLNNSPSP